MLCSRAQNLLSAYCDYELTGEEMLAIRQHLEGCPACAREYASLRQLKSLLKGLPPAEACREFVPKMLEEGPRRRLQTSGVTRLLGSLHGFRRSAYHLATGAVLGLSILAVSALQKPSPPDAVTAKIPTSPAAEAEVVPEPPPSVPVFADSEDALATVGFEPVAQFRPRTLARPRPAEFGGYYVVTYREGQPPIVTVAPPTIRLVPLSPDLNGQ
jgi:hypothetical protein